MACSSCAVTNTTDGASPSPRCKRSTSSRPDNSGMLMSRSSTSYERRSSLLRASTASSAVSATSMSFRSARMLTSAVLARGSSSTIRTRIDSAFSFGVLQRYFLILRRAQRPQRWKHETSGRRFVVANREREGCASSVEILQAGGSILQPESHALAALTADAVANLDLDRPIVLLRCNLDPSAFPIAGDAVHDGIFHEGLQDQLGNQHLRCRRVNCEAHNQSLSKPQLFNIQIGLYKFNLFLKRSEVGACVLQRRAQQAREPDDHCFRNFGVAINERGNTVQSVKQKMRVQLDSQCLKFTRRQRLL